MKNKLIAIELTNHCNFRCILCPHSHYKQKTKYNPFNRKKGFISHKTIQNIIPDLNFHSKNVTIGFFGEPMLHPDFDDIITKIKNKLTKPLILNTNGSLISKEKIGILNKFNCLRLSLDAANAKTWETLCPGGPILDWNGTPRKRRFETLTSKFKKLFKETKRPPIKIVYVRSSNNLNEVKEFVREWRPLLRDRDIISTKSVISYGGVVYDKYMTCQKCKSANQNRLIIAWNGDCSPCNLDVNMVLNIGNINKQSIETIFNSNRYKNIISDIKNKKNICEKCFDGGNHSVKSYRKLI